MFARDTKKETNEIVTLFGQTVCEGNGSSLLLLIKSYDRGWKVEGGISEYRFLKELPLYQDEL